MANLTFDTLTLPSGVTGKYYCSACDLQSNCILYEKYDFLLCTIQFAERVEGC